MDLPHVHNKFLKVPLDILHQYDATTPIDVTAWDHAVLFIMAAWSGASALSFRALNDAIHDEQLDARVNVVVANIDYGTTQEFLRAQGHVAHGMGECYLIRDGKILEMTPGLRNENAAQNRAFVRRLVE